MMLKMILFPRRWRCVNKALLMSDKKNQRRRNSTSHQTEREIMLLEIET